MTPSGARKALRRLTRAGVVEKVGRGKATRYVLNREKRLAHEIAKLFELERMACEPSWSHDPSPESLEPQDGSELSIGSEARDSHGNGNGNGRGNADGTEGGRGRGDGAVDQADRGHGLSYEEVDLDPTSSAFHSALVSLLEEDLSLIRRARERVAERLQHREPGNGHDLWEWRKILDTYPLPRLLHFLESDSPRAVRLRESSPFVDAMSAEDRERLGALVERVH